MAIEYDVSKAFKRVENELIDSMVRNLKRHQVEETLEGLNWEQWQALQLKELEAYRLANPEKFAGDFHDINKKVEEAFRNTYQDASTKEEARILDMIRKGKIADNAEGAIEGSFFGLNASRLEHMVNATNADFARGEWSMLRQANDKYRQIIFDAQVYSATGATYAQAVDMATKDFLRAGIQNITYKNGARHTMQDYAEMAVRTGQKRAYLMGEGDAHDKYGIHTVRVNKRENACPLCVKWLGKVLVDDVYSGGTAEEARKENVPLLSEAIDEGFLHPNCKDVYTMYIEGISKPADKWTKEELEEIAGRYNQEQAIKRAEDMSNTYDRMARCSLDPINKERYQARADAWTNRLVELQDGQPPTPITVAPPITTTETASQLLPLTEQKATEKLKEKSAGYQLFVADAKLNSVEYKTVKPLSKKLSDDEIIAKIAGGDKTGGSCASVAWSYVGNIFGYDVRDFRGGVSCEWCRSNYVRFPKLDGVITKETVEFNGIKGATNLVKEMEEGKTYILWAGRHASVVRQNNGVAEWLELQSDTNSGWHKFTNETLKKRFHCTRQRTSQGIKMKQRAYMFDVSSLEGNEEFENLLGYINTAVGYEKKGVGGSAK